MRPALRGASSAPFSRVRRSVAKVARPRTAFGSFAKGGGMRYPFRLSQQPLLICRDGRLLAGRRAPGCAAVWSRVAVDAGQRAFSAELLSSAIAVSPAERIHGVIEGSRRNGPITQSHRVIYDDSKISNVD